MMTEGYTQCPKCGYEKALFHESSGNEVNWTACPKCRSFYDHGELVEEIDSKFWAHIEEDTGWKNENKNG